MAGYTLLIDSKKLKLCQQRMRYGIPLRYLSCDAIYVFCVSLEEEEEEEEEVVFCTPSLSDM